MRPARAQRWLAWGVCASYMCGFASTYTQISGLAGPRGVFPVADLPRGFLPLLLRPFRRPDVGIDAVCLAGMALSAAGMATARARSNSIMGILWWLYTSLCPDDPPLLQDAGFVAFLTAPFLTGKVRPPLTHRRQATGS
jgi:hypothetical protein